MRTSATRIVLVVTFALCIIAVFLSSFLPTYFVGLRGVQFATDGLRESMAGRTQDILQKYVEDVQLENTEFALKWHLGLVDMSNHQKVLQLLCSELKASKTIVFSQIGTQADGIFLGCEKYPTPTGGNYYDVWFRNASDWSAQVIWRADNTTYAPVVRVKSLSGYDPRKRVWYRVNENSQAWTAPYLYANEGSVGMTAGIPLRHANGSLYGVYAVDITVDSFSNFLQRLDYGQHGNAFVLNAATGELFAVSWSESILIRIEGGNVNDFKIQLRRAENIVNPNVRRMILKLGGSSESILALPPQNIDDGGDWITLADVKDAFGLQFRLVVALDAQEYMGDFNAQRSKVLIALSIVTVGIIILQAVIVHIVLGKLDRALDSIRNCPPTDSFSEDLTTVDSTKTSPHTHNDSSSQHPLKNPGSSWGTAST